MENKHNPFPKEFKIAKPEKIAQLIAIIAIVLISAGLIFYFGHKGTPTNKTETEIVPTSTELTENTEAPVVDISTPESVDLGMIESDLEMTDKNLNTVDNLENL